MRYTWRMLFVVALIVGVSSRSSIADTNPTPDVIFKNHETAVGYSASDGSAKPYVVTMKGSWIDFDHKPHDLLVARHQAGAFYREDQTYLGATSSQGFGDGGFWFSTPNGNTTNDIGLGRELRVTWAIVNAEAYDETLHPESRGVNGDDYVVRIHPDSGMIADVYFNRDSWLTDRVIIDPDNFGFRFDFSDYKRQGPVMVAMTRRRGVTEQRVLDFETYTVTNFQWDASFDAAAFDAPTATRYMTFPSDGKATIPFDFHPGIVVEGSINGASGQFLLDPGQPNMVITSALAAKAQIIPKYAPMQWIGNVYANPVVSMSFGDLKLRDVHVQILDGNYLGYFDGIIGFDVFAQAVVDVDFPRRTVTFSDPNSFKPSPTRHGLPLIVSQGVAQVVITANHSAPMLMEINPAAAGQIALWSAIFHDRVLSDKLGLSNGVIGDLDIGPNSIQHVRVDPGFIRANVWDSVTGSMGLIEGDLLKNYDVTFDEPAATVYIDPDTQP